MKDLMIVNSNIKAYHIFKIRPHPKIEMLIEKEINNPRDPHAMIIKMPPLNKIPNNFHDDVTKEKKGKEKQQTVKDIAGETVGRVPANICKIFEKLLDNGDVAKISCIAVSDPELSTIPPSRQSFKRKLNDHDRRGGGAVVPCSFKLICHDNTYQKVKQYLKKELNELSFQGKETVLEVEESEKVLPLSCPW